MVKSTFCNQLIMSTLLNDTSVIHNKDQICIADRREAVSYDKACSSLHHSFKRFLDL